MGSLFYHFFCKIESNKKWVWFGLSLLLLASLFGILHLKFNEDISKLAPNTIETRQYEKVIRSTGILDKMILMLKNTNEEELLNSAKDMVQLLEGPETRKHIRELNYTVTDEQMEQTYDFFYRHLPLFLDSVDWLNMMSNTETGNIRKALENNLKTLSSPASFATKNFLIKDPLHFTPPILKKLKGFNLSNDIDFQKGFYFSKNHEAIFIFINPVYALNDTRGNGNFLNLLDQQITQLRKKYQTDIYYYGGIPASVGNAKVIKRDVYLTAILSLIALLALLIYYFRSVRLPVLLIIPALISGIIALGMIYFIRGEISAIILGICSVLLGIAIDYAIHISVHFKESATKKEFFKGVSLPLLIGCITTVCSFLMMLFLQSPALKIMGIFAGIAIGLSGVVSLFILPLLLKKTSSPTHNLFIPLARYPFHQKKGLVLFVLSLTVVSFFLFHKVEFEGDLSKLGYESKTLQQAKKEIEKYTGVTQKVVYLVHEGNHFDDALHHAKYLLKDLDSLRDQHLISDYSSLAQIIPDKSLQDTKVSIWQERWETKKNKVLLTLNHLGEGMGFKPGTFKIFESLLNQNNFRIKSEDIRTMKGILGNLYFHNGNKDYIITPLRVKEKNKKEVLQYFSEKEGLFVVDKSYYANSIIRLLKVDFNLLSVLSFLMVFFIIWLAKGRVELAIVNTLPILLAWIITLGVLSFFHIKINIFNIIISSFIFGLGIDYCVFLQHGMNISRSHPNSTLSSYKSSILLSAFTTLIGLGVLILAKHPALKSISALTITGVLSTVLVSFTIQPLLYRRLFYSGKGIQRRYPLIWSNVLRSVWGSFYLILGCLILSIVTFLLNLLPFSKIKKQNWLRKQMMYFARFIILTMPGVKREIINTSGEDFKKPSIIVSNHQSHLDILFLIALHHKSILLTKDWVWKNPFYGYIIRFLDFYPVSRGIEDILPRLKEKAGQGYSIIVFPEGSRNEEYILKRFKKGAFELAEQLKLDILPVVLQGVGEIMTKNEILIKKGKVVIEILPRILYEDKTYGEGRIEKSKKIKKLFERELDHLLNENYTCKELSHQVYNYYLYHNPVLYWYVRVKLKLENYYEELNALIPRKGMIYDIGCGYGYTSLLLKLKAQQREIIGLDFDQKKIDIARSGKLPEGLHFVMENVMQYSFQPADVFIIQDVLHYLTPEEQSTLINILSQKLNKNGMIFLKDADKGDEKHIVVEKEEAYSTQSGFNKMGSDRQLHFLSRSDIENLAHQNGLDVSLIKSDTKNSNKYYKLKKIGE